MEAARFIALFISMFASLLVTFLCLFISVYYQSEEQRKAARDKRIAEHKMAARLLRLNI